MHDLGPPCLIPAKKRMVDHHYKHACGWPQGMLGTISVKWSIEKAMGGWGGGFRDTIAA